MTSILRALSRQKHNFIAKSDVRTSALWHGPKFKGGDARVNELGRLLRQWWYKDGEKFASAIVIFGVGPLSYLYLYTNEKWVTERKAKAEKYAKTCYRYPDPVRDED